MVKSVNNLPDGGICYQMMEFFFLSSLCLLLFNFEFLYSLFFRSVDVLCVCARFFSLRACKCGDRINVWMLQTMRRCLLLQFHSQCTFVFFLSLFYALAPRLHEQKQIIRHIFVSQKAPDRKQLVTKTAWTACRT